MILAGLAVLADAKFLETSIKQFTREDVFFCPIFTAHVKFLSLTTPRGVTACPRSRFLSLLSIVPETPNDGLPAIAHMDVLDADKLLAAVAQPPKHFNLGRISPH